MNEYIDINKKLNERLRGCESKTLISICPSCHKIFGHNLTTGVKTELNFNLNELEEFVNYFQKDG